MFSQQYYYCLRVENFVNKLRFLIYVQSILFSSIQGKQCFILFIFNNENLFCTQFIYCVWAFITFSIFVINAVAFQLFVCEAILRKLVSLYDCQLNRDFSTGRPIYIQQPHIQHQYISKMFIGELSTVGRVQGGLLTAKQLFQD